MIESTDVPEAERPTGELALRAAERLTFFSDAVVAIAITLLALDLPVPTSATSNAELLRSLSGYRNEYLAFLISFVVVATYWNGHHRLFTYVIAVPRHLNRWNMLWLLTVVVTPSATKLLTGDRAFSARFIVYAAVQALAGTFYLLMLYTVDRGHALSPETPPGMVAANYRRLGVTVTAFLVSIPVSLVTHWAYLCWIAAPVALNIWRRLDGRRAPSSE